MTGYVTEIKFSRKKIVRLLLLALSCLVVSFLVFLDTKNVLMVSIAGIAGILLFGTVFCVAVYKFFIKRPAVIIYSDGFVYNRNNTKSNFIYWSEVQHIIPIPVYGTLHVVLSPQAGETSTAEHTKKIIIPANLLTVSPAALNVMLVQQWTAYKKDVADKAAELALASILKTKTAEELITTDEVECLAVLKVEDIIGKKIIDILIKTTHESNGMETSESFLFIEGDIAIEIPYNFSTQHISSTTIAWEAKSIFDNLEDTYSYSINKRGRPNGQMEPQDFVPYKTERIENKVRYLQNSRMVDIICYTEDTDLDKSFIELDNGFLITEINFGVSGTGRTGLWYYDSIATVEKRFGTAYTRWSATKNV